MCIRDSQKKVAKRKKKVLVWSKVTIAFIKEDSSANKQSSHQRLQAMLVQQEKSFQSTVYTKSDVEMICKAYGVSFWQSDTKAKLSEKLVEKTQASEHILHPYLGWLRTGTATRTLCRSCNCQGTQPARVSFNNLTRCMKLFITVTSKLLKIILLKKLV